MWASVCEDAFCCYEFSLTKSCIKTCRLPTSTLKLTPSHSTSMAQDLSQTSIATVSIHALSCGHFTLPSHQFIAPSTLEARKTVPSLAFLIQHKADSGKVTRILFDLGLRRDLKRYPLQIQKHTENRQPLRTDPDVVENLARGGLKPDDIDYVMYSHVRENTS